jgi:2-polyprenyl-3-methyl-5-hydroxy-6-metoxy-1,4-benzoquinol methylase
MDRRQEFRRGDDLLVKEPDPATGRHRFQVNGREVSIGEWNRRVNRLTPMDLKTTHPFAPVRWLEGRRRATMLRLARREAYSRALDAGCEAGHFTRSLARSGAAATGVDLDPDMLARARAAAAGTPAASFACASVESLPFADATFDFVLCAETLEHVDDPGRAVREIVRVTRPGGRFLLAVPNDRLVLGIKRLLRATGLGRLLGGLAPGLAMGHLRVFDRANLLALLPGDARAEKVIRDAPFFLNLYLLGRRCR